MDTLTLGRVALVPRGEYDPDEIYEPLDIVSYHGSSYIVIQSVWGQTPPPPSSGNNEHYMLLASKGDNFALPSDGNVGQTLINAGNDTLKYGNYQVNANLLINSDFDMPVNSNGRREYTSVGITIDGWKHNSGGQSVILEDGYILLTALPDAIMYYRQNLSKWLSEALIGKEVTLSFLFNDNTLISSTGIVQSDTVQFMQVNYPKGSIFLRNEDNVLVANISVIAGSSTGIVAAKLEPGNEQTLAHKDANGKWVRNREPNYDIQHILCSLYSPTTGEFVGNQHVNTNLLDNAYWKDVDCIIDQRCGYYAKAGTPYYTDSTWSTQVGILEADTQLLSYTSNIGVFDINGTRYSVTDPAHTTDPVIFRGYVGLRYTIDRWNSGSQRTIVQIDENGLSLDCTEAGVSYWSQQIPDASAYIGETVTASALLEDNTLIVCTGTVVPIPTASEYTQFAITGSQHAYARLELYTFRAGTLCYQFRIAGKFRPIAGKFERGPVQTLAHKEGDTWVLNDPPPNKALELTKCQRYQLGYYTAGTGVSLLHGHLGKLFTGPESKNSGVILIPLPTTMRNSNPTVSTMNTIRLLYPATTQLAGYITGVSVYGITPSYVAITCTVDRDLPANSVFEVRGNGSHCGFFIDNNF